MTVLSRGVVYQFSHTTEISPISESSRFRVTSA
jgi:hypothetical protein